MSNSVVRLLGLMSLVISAGCANVVPVGAGSQAEWTGSMVVGQSTTRDKPLLQFRQGNLTHVRYSALQTLTLHDFQSNKDVLVGLGDLDNATLDGISTFSADANMYVAWRSKLRARSDKGLGEGNDKMVYVARSTSGGAFSAPTRISNGNGAFPPILAGNKTGDVYAVWQDERAGASFDLHFNVSHDFGATWKEKDVRLDIGKESESFSGEPNLYAEGKSLWLTWVESGKNGCGVYVRTSVDSGESWFDAVEVAPCTSHQSLYPQLVYRKGQLFVYWFDQNKVRGAASADGGKTWNQLVHIATIEAEGVSMQELLVKADSAGVVHLIFGKKGNAKGGRTNLYYTRSDDGAVFSPAARLNSGVEYESSAILAQIAFDNANRVQVAWQDYRFFRPIVMGNFSPDQGKTWEVDSILDSGPASGASQFPHLVANDAQWWLSYIHYDRASVNKMENGSVVVKQIDPTKKTADSSPDKYKVDTSKLERRVEAWWESRLKADWGATYELMDPFMRASTKKATYIASQGFVNYYAYSIIRTELLTNNQAKVTLKFTSEVPEMEVNGKTYSVPKKETELVQDWIWVDGNWYFLFKDLMGSNFREL